MYLKFKAETMIKAVTLIPGFTIGDSDWYKDQNSVAVYGKTVEGT